MPNFNGAIIVHTLQLLKAPATLREIVVTIAKNTELSQDELKEPVKQTLEMGHRLGFLQKLDGEILKLIFIPHLKKGKFKRSLLFDECDLRDIDV